MLPDLRSSLRALRRTPLSTTAAVLTLALGIGATTTIYGVVDATMLRPLPWPAADRLMDLSLVLRQPSGDSRTLVWSYPKFETMRALQRSFEDVAAYATQDVLLAGGEGSERVRLELVSGSYFPILRTPMALGRGLQPSDDSPSANPVTVLSHALFMRRFGGDSSIVGREIRIEGEVATVVGVAAPGLRGLSGEVQLWVPFALAPRLQYPEVLSERWYHFADAVGRLRDGVTPQAAAAEMSSLGRQVDAAHPSPSEGGSETWGAVAASLRDARNDPTLSRAVLILFGAVACVLLIACVNVANLLLARSVARTREFAVRIAIGARRSQLVAQLLTETLLLSVLGGALGAVIATWSVEAVRAVVPDSAGHVRTQVGQFLDLSSVQVNTGVLTFGIALSLVTGLLCGLVPALRASRPAIGAALKDGAGASSEGALSFRRGPARAMLVTGNVALSLLLLVGAGLLSRSFAKARGIDAGFIPANVYTFRVQPPRDSMYSGTRATQFRSDLMARLTTLPGVEAVGTDRCAPLSQGCGGTVVTQVDGVELAEHGTRPQVGVHIVNDGYLKAIGARLLVGRFLDDRDAADAPKTAVINATAAGKLFPDGNAIGRRIGIGFSNWSSAEVVGVVSDVSYGAVGNAPSLEFYGSFRQTGQANGMYFVRSSGDPSTLASAVRATVHAISPDLAVYDERTLEARVGSALGRLRFGAVLLGAFAGLGLVLALIGIYAVLAYSVSQRTRELGIRMALGAVRGEVVALIMRRAMFLTALGISIGLVSGWGASRLLSSLVFGITTTDPLTFGGQTLLLLGACALASYLPARRAARLDPVQALRAD